MKRETRRLKDLVRRLEAERKQDQQTLLRTQQLLLDFIWFKGFSAYHQPAFGGFEFISRGDHSRFQRMNRAILEHAEDLDPLKIDDHDHKRTRNNRIQSEPDNRPAQ